jgi:DNA-binding NarL/FixJ family response regulator
MSNTPIILAEDNPRDTDYLCQLLKPREILRTSTGKAALSAALNYDEPLVISDLQMPEMNGIELAKQLWSARPQARIVFWSQYRDELYVRSLARLIPANTVYGYILKDNANDMVLRAINAVFEDNQCWIDPQIRPIQARLQRPKSSLSDAEYDVLIDIALGLTDNAIGRRRYLSRRGVQNRLRSLYNKLDADQLEQQASSDTDTINIRSRAISVAFMRGLVNKELLAEEEQLLQRWLKDDAASTP